MNTINPTTATQTKSRFLAAGAAMIAFPILANIPYALLVQRFGYDDVLREPPLDVLRAFTAGGPELVLIWLAFACAALSFVFVAGLVNDAARGADKALPSFVGMAGVASALAQAIGLSRWVFAIPVIARMAEDPAQRDIASALYTTLNQFAGVGIGEFVGQTLLVIWTAGVSWKLIGGGFGSRIMGWAGLVISAAWIVGQSELLGTVIPHFPVVEAAPIAFMGWEAWLAVLGMIWIVRGVKRS